MRKSTLILGSKSPRRAEILGYFSLPFRQEASDFDEDAVPFTGDPRAYANTLSRGKAELLSVKYPESLIMTADTVVYREGRIYGKPVDEQDALKIFSELIGRWHSVFTSVTVKQGLKEYQQVEETRVLFNALNDRQIIQYMQKIEWADKAGGYAIQMAGGLIVNRIEGCYYNVMGLPINTVELLLKKFGIELWDYL